jgi:DNA (cytosine-5)-methyltransferase 1
MSWDKPAPTITTQFFGFGNGRFGHPEAHRAISLREGAVLQSFPKSYKFVRKSDDINFSSIGRLIGNAVPVILGQLIGRSLIRHVQYNKHQGCLINGERLKTCLNNKS